jgi:hypothetical protein
MSVLRLPVSCRPLCPFTYPLYFSKQKQLIMRNKQRRRFCENQSRKIDNGKAAYSRSLYTSSVFVYIRTVISCVDYLLEYTFTDWVQQLHTTRTKEIRAVSLLSYILHTHCSCLSSDHMRQED